MMGSERQANDGREQETVGRMMGKSERQASDGEEQERHATDGGSDDGEDGEISE